MEKWEVKEQKSPIGEMRISIEEHKIYMQYRNNTERAAMHESAIPWLQGFEAESRAEANKKPCQCANTDRASLKTNHGI